jgi:3-phosphoshikimate 1-carboxyvinyltransferase
MRLLAGLLAGQPFGCTITGDGALQGRPMDRIITPLREMGARIHGQDHGRFAPLTLKGGPLKPIRYDMPVASAQVKSAILLAGLYAPGRTGITEPAPCRDHTERMLQFLGKEVLTQDGEVLIEGGGELQATRIEVPGDLSSAAYFLVAAAVIPKSKVVIKGVGVNPTRTGIIEALRKMGADIAVRNERLVCNEPVADIEMRSSRLQGTEIFGKLVPTLIDELPVLAVAATQAYGTTIVRDAAELRVKETDRIRAVARELLKLGAKIEERKDGWAIEGPTQLRGNGCRSYGDHRMAMALTVAGLMAEGKTVIARYECVNISFPGFLEKMEKVVKR